MINRQLITRLAKLRQYKSGDIKEFMTTQFRQNMLAIESAIGALANDPFYVRTQLEAFSTAQNAVNDVVFLESGLRSDLNNCIQNNAYLCKSSGFYAVKFNITNVLCPGTNAVFVSVFVNDINTILLRVLENPSASNLTLPFSLEYQLELKTDDVLRFTANNSGSSATVSTSGVGTLEIRQLTKS